MRLEWKHRFLTTGLPGKSVHSIVKNICFQKKKKGKEGRQGRKKTGDRRQEREMYHYCVFPANKNPLGLDSF